MIIRALVGILCLFVVGTSALQAKNYPDGGFYGSATLLYYDDYYESNRSYNAQQNFIHEYTAGYRGNIYSPRLLDYALEGVLRFEKIDTQSNIEQSKTDTMNQDYKVNLDFIKETRYPFTLYAQRTNRPVSTIYAESINRYTQDLEKYGINGSLKFDSFTLGYGASKDKSIYEGVISTQERETDIYQVSLRKHEKAYSLQLNYNHLERDIDQSGGSVQNIVTTKETDNTIDLAYRLSISKALALDTNINYLVSDYFNSKTTTANFNLRWNPEAKYYTSFSLSGSRSDYFTDTLSEAAVFSERIDTFTINQSFGYNLTPSLLLTETIALYSYKSMYTQGDNANIRLGANYSKSFSTGTQVRLSTSVDSRMNENQRTSAVVDGNETKNQDSLGFNVRIGLSQQMPALNSTLSMGGNYYSTLNSEDETRNRYSANFSFSSTIFGTLRNRIDANYLYEESDTLSYVSDEMLYLKVVRTDIGEYFDYSARLGIRGNVTLKAGVLHSEIENDGVRITRTVPRAELNLNYRFWQRLICSAGGHVDKDLSYNYLNYSAVANVSYRLRKTSFSMGYQYYKTKVEEPSDFPERQRSRFDVTLTRTF